MAEPRSPWTCPQHGTISEKVNEVCEGVNAIREILGDGKVKFATIALRIHTLELVVYGAVGATLLAVSGAVLAKVIGGQ
jgi:hypothetical protein